MTLTPTPPATLSLDHPDFEAALAAALPPRRRAAEVRRFLVTAIRPDGSFDTRQVSGGNNIDHALAAQEAAGLGGVVRVLPLQPGDAA